MTLSENLFAGEIAEDLLEEQLSSAGVIFDRLAWDSYDNSLEIYGVPADMRLDVGSQKICHDAGFSTAYVNHVDKWETHYHFKHGEELTPSKGWRVCYESKHGLGSRVLVEECPEGWPKQWLETGYVYVKALA